jgi:cobalt-zinc-cadmium efflux system membrane fusion protein
MNNHLTLLLAVLTIVGIATAAEEHDHDHAAENKLAAEAHSDDKHGHEEGHADEVRLTPEAIQRYGIKVAPATRQALTPTVSVPARVTFNTEAMAPVGSAVQGRASEIRARVGDLVKKGDELLVVESPTLGEAQSDYLQKRTAVVVARSAIEPARDAADRAKKLYDSSQGISLGEVQKRSAELKAAEGALQTAEAAATAAENKLHLLGMDQKAVADLVASKEINPRYVIRAPIGGQVIEREVTLGELVAPEKEALLVLADPTTLWVIADVPEARLRDVTVGAGAQIRVGAIGDEPVAGKVSFVAPSIDANTRTAQVRIEVPNGNGRLKPGMFATAVLAASHEATGQAVLSVPDAAVQTVEGGPAVFVPVAGEPNTFAKRAVNVGAAVGGVVPITSGLKEGEPVVVSGSFILKAELGKGEAAHEH